MVVDNISTTYLIPKAILLIGIGFAVISAVVYIQLQADGLLLGGNDVLPGGGLLLHALLSLDLREKGGSSKHFIRHQNGDKSKI